MSIRIVTFGILLTGATIYVPDVLAQSSEPISAAQQGTIEDAINTDLPIGQVKYVRFDIALQLCRDADDIQDCVDRKTGQKSRGVIMPTGQLGEGTKHTRAGVSVNGIFRTCSVQLVDGKKQKICHTQ